MHLYPMAPEMKQRLDDLQAKFASADLGLLILCVAAVPAVCEELAFRGFILSGCRNLGNNWRAIVVSAIFFGVTHGFLQQSINACLLGIVLGYLAVRSGSLLPGVVFHFLHNAHDGPQREGHARVDRPRSRPGFPRATQHAKARPTSGPFTCLAA